MVTMGGHSRIGGNTHAGGDRAGESSRCEDPAPTVGIGGEIVAGYAAPTIVYAHIGINGSGEWADNDEARRVATPSKERENMF